MNGYRYQSNQDMINTHIAPMMKYSSHVQTKTDTISHEIYKTTDYEKFKILNGNRKPNEIHVRRLVESFKKNYLISPIIVNDKWQIIDGQHRYLAARELKLPIHYLMLKGYGLEEVQIFNTNSSNWKKEDYLKGYCDLGYTDYLQMKQFMFDFPDFGIASAEQLLTNTVGGANNKNEISETRSKIKNFQEGRFKIFNLDKAYENAEKVMMFKNYYDGYNRSVFVAALIGMFKNENYNHAEMISKLSFNPTALQHCSNVTQYKHLLEEIYNYKRRVKLSLRY
jgi:hypothetical protein